MACGPRVCGATFVDVDPVGLVCGLQTARDDAEIGLALRAAVEPAIDTTKVCTPDGSLVKFTTATMRRNVRDVYAALEGLQAATPDPRKVPNLATVRARAMTCWRLLAAVVPMELAAYIAGRVRLGTMEGGPDAACQLWVSTVKELGVLVCGCEHLKADALGILQAAAGAAWTVPADHRASFGVGSRCAACRKQPRKGAGAWGPQHTLELEKHLRVASDTLVYVRHASLGNRPTRVPLSRAVSASVVSWEKQTMRVADGLPPAEVSRADRPAKLGDIVYLLGAVAAMCRACEAVYHGTKTRTPQQARVASAMFDLGRAWPAIRASWTRDGSCPGMPFTTDTTKGAGSLCCAIARATPRLAQVATATSMILSLLGGDCGRRAHALSAFNVALICLDVAGAVVNVHTRTPPLNTALLVPGPLVGACPGTVCSSPSALVLPEVLSLAAADVPTGSGGDLAEAASQKMLASMFAPQPLAASAAVEVVAAGYGGAMVATSLAHWQDDIALLCAVGAAPPAAPSAAPCPADTPLVFGDDDGEEGGDTPLVFGDDE